MRVQLCLFVVALVLLSTECRRWIRASKRDPFTISRYVVKVIQRSSLEIRRYKSREARSSCIEDSYKTTQDPFLTCENDLNQLGSDQAISDSEINSFCTKNCSGVIVNLYKAIQRDCGLDPSNHIDDKTLNFLLQTCDHDPHGRYCLYDWMHGESLYPSTGSDEYTECVQSYQKGSKECPNSCRTTLQDIRSTFGCCYTTIAQDESTDDNGTTILPLSLFRLCGLTKPSFCTS